MSGRGLLGGARLDGGEQCGVGQLAVASCALDRGVPQDIAHREQVDVTVDHEENGGVPEVVDAQVLQPA